MNEAKQATFFEMAPVDWKNEVSMNEIKNIVKKIFGRNSSPKDAFLSYHYQRHNQRRLEHLASLGLDLHGATVLEVGAGIGDHTSFFIDRGCQVVSTDARESNLDILRSRYPHIKVRHLDCDQPDAEFDDRFDMVYCYGLLYHLRKPAEAIDFMSRRCKKMLLLETCVSMGDGDSINLCAEDADNPTQAISGKGCRPTRYWVYTQLKKHFEHVYLPTTQPNHEEFPVDWRVSPGPNRLTRAVFVASRHKLDNKFLIQEIPMQQARE
jgi:ubiquinone/menaquinone biosynthesis C-methylase UbiE